MCLPNDGFSSSIVDDLIFCFAFRATSGDISGFLLVSVLATGKAVGIERTMFLCTGGFKYRGNR